jgi:hypothetical protein
VGLLFCIRAGSAYNYFIYSIKKIYISCGGTSICCSSACKPPTDFLVDVGKKMPMPNRGQSPTVERQEEKILLFVDEI